ncbi:MAG: TatD family hydrolase [Elusimicrobia bacterium]|nr:TatD family hydrolase [Elusimicrobiota bacterium]
MIDTHCHLLDSSFDKDRQEVIERAFDKGISCIIEISEEPSLWQNSLKLCRDYQTYKIFCAIGVHPNHADKYVDPSSLVEDKLVVGIGECGLDYYRKYVDSKTQMDVFERQLEIAEKYKKPVVVHCRKAEKDVYEILCRQQNVKGVIHCFSSTLEFAEKFLQIGFYIGIDAPVTYPNAGELREVVRKIPLERILIETDSPYLPPQQYRGKRNEPSYAEFVAEEIARLKKISVETVIEVTDINAEKLFKVGE